MRRAILAVLLPLAMLACDDTSSDAESETTQAGLANPASENCVKEGGKLVMETAGNGGQYGVCVFEDNRQCEEWALLRGQCPEGGLKVTGYVTDAARYCAIRGGSYSVTAEASGDQPEKGDCTLADGTTCSADDYYNGTCPKS